MCEFIANGESLALWIPMVQGEEGREGRSRGKARQGEGIRRKEKIAALGLYKDWNEQRKVRSERANWIEGIDYLGQGTWQKVSGSFPVRSRARSEVWGWKSWWVLREGWGEQSSHRKQRVWVCLWSPRRRGGC